MMFKVIAILKIITLFIMIGVFIFLIFNQFRKKKKDVNLFEVKCPKCGKKQKFVRVPKDIKEAVWGGYTCPNCGCKMDKFGKEIL